MVSSFGAKLRYLRLQREWTQIELAQRLSLATNTHISQMEAGIREPSVALVRKIAECFDVTIDYLLRDTLPVAQPQVSQFHQPDRHAALASFGTKLRHLRKQHGLTQVVLAHQLEHITHTHISHLEADRKEPSIDLVLRIADVFGVSTDYLLRDALPVDATDDDDAAPQADEEHER
jgi:transcriptional regulator with XRE-family HTH domain